MNKIFMRGNFRGNVRGEYKNNYRNDSYDRSRNRSRERLLSRNYGNNQTRSTSQSRSRSGPELAQIGIEFIVISAGNMIISHGDCPTSREEKEIEQLQQMLNLGNEQLIIPPMSNMQAELSRVSSEENLRLNHLNL